MKPIKYEVTVFDYDQNTSIRLGTVTVTEKMYRREQAKIRDVMAKIKYLPKHCAQQLAKRTFQRKDVHVKMI